MHNNIRVGSDRASLSRMKVKYLNNIDEFDDLLDYFQRQKAPCIENYLGENILLDRLIAMDDVSGLTDRSDSLAQTKIFNIFPGSTQASSIIKVLSSFRSRYKYNYVPKRDLWINRLYFDISNSTDKQCLTIDTWDVNDLGPAKFGKKANTNQEQICYYNRNKRDTSFNSFLAVRKQTSPSSDITFSVIKLIDKTNKNSSIYFEINNELSDFNNGSDKGTVQWVSEVCTSGTITTDGKRQRREQSTARTNRHGRFSKKPRFLSR